LRCLTCDDVPMTQVADNQGPERDEAEDVPKPLIRFEDFATCILPPVTPELEQEHRELGSAAWIGDSFLHAA
jgi:hypothetical protein